ncbi:thermonuclease family protein [Phyllobacterium zundukense]|jgi:endonuclease YncB( thermonuclease family)|uniref:Thermonuclease family protein n=1 Tax=Phyllobacterium zundukense TaxID=1867719 RepID=A0ACD4D1Y1_9HYPH|nr:thermonuclease family protein [Phyllobacterium zundukense]UXN59799.1 thermonuclease family protein [Phyllobacterium zundukense]
MVIFFVLVALLAAKLSQPKAPTQLLAGTAYVIDGDTLSISGNHIRLQGIDAPELDQSCGANACGKSARQTLVQLIQGRPVRCDGYGHDKYNRSLAICFIGPINLNRAMVEAGQAIAYGDYRDVELQARRDKKGLWSGKFETPQDWRREHEQVPEVPGQQPTAAPDLIDQFVGWIRGLVGGL